MPHVYIRLCLNIANIKTKIPTSFSFRPRESICGHSSNTRFIHSSVPSSPIYQPLSPWCWSSANACRKSSCCCLLFVSLSRSPRMKASYVNLKAILWWKMKRSETKKKRNVHVYLPFILQKILPQNLSKFLFLTAISIIFNDYNETKRKMVTDLRKIFPAKASDLKVKRQQYRFRWKK